MPAFVHCSSSRSGLASARSEDFSRIFCSPAICEVSGCWTLASVSLLLIRMGIPYGETMTQSTPSTTGTSGSWTQSRRRPTASAPATRGQVTRSPRHPKNREWRSLGRAGLTSHKGTWSCMEATASAEASNGSDLASPAEAVSGGRASREAVATNCSWWTWCSVVSSLLSCATVYFLNHLNRKKKIVKNPRPTGCQ